MNVRIIRANWSCIYHCSVLLLGVPLWLAQNSGEQAAMGSEFVSADLKGWSLRSTSKETVHPAGIAVLDSDGSLFRRGSGGHESIEELPPELTKWAFEAARDILNEYRLQRVRDESDVKLSIELRDEAGRGMELEIDSNYLESQHVSPAMAAAFEEERLLLSSNGARHWELLTSLRKKRQAAPRGKREAVREGEEDWELYIYEGNDPNRPKDAHLEIRPQFIRLRRPDQTSLIKTSLADLRSRRAIVHKFFEGFMLQNQELPLSQKLFTLSIRSGGMLATFTLDHTTLDTLGLKTEINTWIGDMNGRLKASGHNAQFNPAWNAQN